MKLVIFIISAIGLSIPCFGQGVYVNGYYKNNGTYVSPHHRSRPNNSVYDNYSTRGNTNPYTGRAGTRSPWKSYRSPSLPTHNQQYKRRW